MSRATTRAADRGKGPLALIVWGNWGPYHIARFASARSLCGEAGWRLEGIQLYASSGIYSWSGAAIEGVHDIGLEPPEMQFRPLRTLFGILPLLVRRRPSVVVLPSYWHWSLLINVCARVLGARTVMMNDTHARTSRAEGGRMRFKAFVVRRFASALVAGEPQREFFEGLGLAPQRIFVGYDVVDNDHFSNAAAAARRDRVGHLRTLELPDRYILSLGRLVAKKNLPLLVDAYASLRSRLGGTAPSLVIVGEGELLPRLLEQCARFGLTVANRHPPDEPHATSADVHLYPYADYETTPVLMALADAFVLASTSEEWGLVINEAMASTTCVVVSDAVGCVADLCLDGTTALVFASSHVDELSAALERVTLDETLRIRLAAAGGARIHDWGLDRFARGCLDAIVAAAPPRALTRTAVRAPGRTAPPAS